MKHESLQYQVQKPYVPILPASPFKGKPGANLNAKPPINSQRNNINMTNAKNPSTRNIHGKKQSQDSTAIFVPRGWNRILEKELITYVSPNKSRLRSMEDLIDYLQREGTCKCGLECPFKPDQVFNFNPKVQSCFGFLPTGVDSNRETSCAVCKKFEELFPCTTKSKQTRGRKAGGKNKRAICSERNSSPEPKKILLTGASPLEAFQTKMDAMNAASSQFMLSFQQNKDKLLNTNNLLKNDQSEPNLGAQLSHAAEEIVKASAAMNKKPPKRRAKIDKVKKTTPSQTQNNHMVSTAKDLIIGQLHGLIDAKSIKTDSNFTNKSLSNMHNIPSSLIKGALLSSKTTNNFANVPFQVSQINSVPQLPSQMSSKISPSSIAVSTSEGRGQQQMLLLQLVNQSKPQSVSTKNFPLSSSPHSILISSTPTLQTLALQKSQQIISSPVNIATVNSVNSLPVQYVVNPPTGYTIKQQPIIRYVSQDVSTVSILSSASKPILKQSSPVPSNYVRIAPAVATPSQTTVVEISANPLEIEEENQKRQLHASMLQAITGKRMSSEKVYETIPAAQQFLSNIAKEEQAETLHSSHLQNKGFEAEEMELQCEESSSSLTTEETKDDSTSRNLTSSDVNTESNLSNQRIVWVHLPGFPNWPGKIISHLEASKPPLKNGQVYVSMFLTNQIHAVTIDNQLFHFDKDVVQLNWESKEKQGSDLGRAVQLAIEDVSWRSSVVGE
ncbi:uncharacterized protein [Clytia hemisphaerica]|uniref:PWWP domain-containing protein n=1 Tax=Clytia hemisphaerica TaxID=252671 RepID=A0A7M5V205_9CNID